MTCVADGSYDIGYVQASNGAAVIGDDVIAADVTCGLERHVGHSWAGLTFRRQDAKNYYAALLSSERQKIILQLVENGCVSELAAEDVAITLGVAIEVKVVLDGTGIEVYCDDLKLIDVTDATFASGTVGVKMSRSASVVGEISVGT